MTEQWHNRYVSTFSGPFILFVVVSIIVIVPPAQAENSGVTRLPSDVGVYVASDATNSVDVPPLAPSYDAASSDNDGVSILSDLSLLEYRLFAKEYTNEDVERRLDRIERVVFGSRKTGAVDARIANLMSEVAIAPSGPVADTGGMDGYKYNGTGAAIATSEQPTSLLEVIANMETEVFGKTYPHDTLMARVARLEKSVLPAGTEQSLTPLPVRIHNLLVALQPKIQYQGLQNQNTYLPTTTGSQSYSYARTPSSYSFSTSPTTYSYSATGNDDYEKQGKQKTKSSNGHPLMKKLGQILEGVGTVAGATVGAMAASSAMYGAYGWGYPGYYGGGWGPYYGYGYSPFYRW